MAKEYRPILNLRTTSREKIYDSISLGLALLSVSIALWSYLNLPDTIPIHWNFKGEADGYGSKHWIAFIPVLSVLYLLGNRMLVKIPHKYNYLKKITEENVKQEYIKGRKLLRIVHLVAQFVFTLIVYSMIRGAVTEYADLNVFVLPIALVITIAPLLYVVLSNKK